LTKNIIKRCIIDPFTDRIMKKNGDALLIEKEEK
jgi:hypothetical protein